ERDVRGVDLHVVGFAAEELLVERHRALAVAAQAVRLRLGKEKLAPRIQRVARVELADRARVVLGAVELEPALVVRARLVAHCRLVRRRGSWEREQQRDDEITAKTPRRQGPDPDYSSPDPALGVLASWRLSYPIGIYVTAEWANQDPRS